MADAETEAHADAWVRSATAPAPAPAARRLRGYAFDPSLSTQLDTALVNEVVFRVPWEESHEELAQGHRILSGSDRSVSPDDGLRPGPVGEYLEVIDYDPASHCYYAPIDLNSPLVLAQDGLAPTEGNPQFHQQMVYAVAMTTIKNFERALGRYAFWAPNIPRGDDGKATGDRWSTEDYVRRLRIYPHAIREANAYYSPAKKALLFGYFIAPPSTSKTGHYPGGMVFTCLSHDVVAHETTHALLDGMHRRYTEATNPDMLAFHEAIADLVALFQHFTFPSVLRHQIAKTRGDLTTDSELGKLAQQLGQAVGLHGGLRSAIGQVDDDGTWRLAQPDPQDYLREREPHARGAILVAAVFDAFLAIYRSRVSDLYRIATSGTGILAEGAIHPDLVGRLAAEAAKSAQHVLNMCIRALDYTPPVDLTFGDYLRALITADSDLVPDDDLGYRVAFIEAFRRRGIYPPDVRTLSVDSLRWPIVRGVQSNAQDLIESIQGYVKELSEPGRTRSDYYAKSKKLQHRLHQLLSDKAEFRAYLEAASGTALCLQRRGLAGLEERDGQPKFEIHSVRSTQRVGPDGQALNHAVISITQKRFGDAILPQPLSFRGGATLIFNLDTARLQYAITKSVCDEERLENQRRFLVDQGATSLRAAYFGNEPGDPEPFAMLHRHAEAP